MSYLDRVLDSPSYGYEKDGALYVPTHQEILREFFGRLNVFRDRKNWLPLFSWVTSLSLGIPLGLFLIYHFSLPLFILGFVYSMVVLGSHGTIWLHRYGTHRAYQFKNAWARNICRNLVIKIIPEETYIVSHHVHHSLSEKPGDPYNTHAGFLYCFLADVNHQSVNKNLSREDYTRLVRLVEHTGVRINTYEQYQKWGSICHPLTTFLHFALNWCFWYGLLYLIGGNSLALAIFGMSGVWAIGVRTFNYDGHGRGQDKRRPGIDFNNKDYSINQVWPGYVAGEWHNNHHLYPNSARNDFMAYQLDLPWLFIRAWSKLGLVSSYKDNKADFIKNYYLPYLDQQRTVNPAIRPAYSPDKA
jgi:stearoyl-CoA desaturase (delta-9 desaturase)